ncbi:hypothetical protein L7F22_010324 [Adiantum nelumboides]|nr:hypothetical protein [Adiantum nelumboides]
MAEVASPGAALRLLGCSASRSLVTTKAARPAGCADVGGLQRAAVLPQEDPYILCWDLRNTSGTVYKLERQARDTNQRIYFDIEPCGRHLGSGGQDGYVRLYDLQTGLSVSSFQVATDTCNGFSFHPSLPLGVSTSGQRRYVVFNDETEDIEVNDAAEEKDKVLENCASVWRFVCSWDDPEITDHPAEQPDSDMINLSA